MKKISVLLSIALCLAFAGCGIAKEESVSSDEIHDFYDNHPNLNESYSETDMVIDVLGDIVSCKAAEFHGRRSLCVLWSGKKSKANFNISFSLSSGNAEIVMINGGNEQTVAEYNGETKIILQNVELDVAPQTQIRIMLVGDNCRDMELTMRINQEV